MTATRNTDPATSFEAAASINDLRDRQSHVLNVLVQFGAMTDQEMVREFRSTRAAFGYPDQSESGLRTRRKELVDLGLVRDSGTRGTTDGGRASIRWEYVPLGEQGAALSAARSAGVSERDRSRLQRIEREHGTFLAGLSQLVAKLADLGENFPAPADPTTPDGNFAAGVQYACSELNAILDAKMTS